MTAEYLVLLVVGLAAIASFLSHGSDCPVRRRLYKTATKPDLHGRIVLDHGDEVIVLGEGTLVQPVFRTPAKCMNQRCGLTIELVSVNPDFTKHSRLGVVRKCPLCGELTLKLKSIGRLLKLAA